MPAFEPDPEHRMMNNRFSPRALLRATFLAVATLAALPAAQAHDYRLGDLEIRHPWVRATRPGQPHAGGYIEVRNLGKSDDRLVGLRIPKDVAERGELHTMRMEGDVMRMRQVEGLPIPAGGAIRLQPGGDHLMLIDVRRPMTVGTKIKGVLVFEKAGEIPVELHVEERPAGAAAAVGGHDHGHGGHRH